MFKRTCRDIPISCAATATALRIPVKGYTPQMPLHTVGGRDGVEVHNAGLGAHVLRGMHEHGMSFIR